MFTQSIKFYTFHYQYRCLKNVIHQIDNKNGWLLLSASFAAKLVFVLTLKNAKRHFKVRICERLGIPHLTEKKVKIGNNKLTAIQEHLLCFNFEDFSILTRESNGFKLKIMESVLIACDKPILNKADSSLPLELF